MPTVEELRAIAERLKIELGELPSATRIAKQLDGNLSTNYARVTRMLTEGVDYAKPLTKLEAARLGGAPIAKHIVRADDQEGLKKLKNKVDKLNRVNKLADKGIKFMVSKTSGGNFSPELSYMAGIYRESLGKTRVFGPLEDLIEEFNKFKKTDLFKNYSKSATMKEGGVKSSLKQLKDQGSKKIEAFEYLSRNPETSVKNIAKDLGVKTGAATNTIQSLFTDIYKRIGDQGAAYLKPYSIAALDSVRDVIKNSDVNLKDRVRNLVTEAYRGDQDLKPILKRLGDFYKIQSELKKTPYGKFFAANLDHPVPLNFIRQVNEGADPLNLIRVRPIPEFLNQRAFKAQFDKALGTAYKSGDKKALETIVRAQSYLPEEFGGITAEGKITNFGAKPFSLKTDLRTTSFPEIYDRVFKFINEPDLQTTFKDAKVSFKSLAAQEKTIRNLASTFPSQIKKLIGNLTEQEKIAYCSLLSRGGLPGDCAAAIDNDPVKASKVFAEAPATSSAMTKVKNAALGFLRSGGFKTFGAGAAIGTAIGLVKAFRNDDPTTYLSNEDQQKNMLVDMATQPVSIDIERPAILDYQLPALGASLAASTALAAPSTIKASKSRSAGIEKSKRLGGPRPGLAKTGLRVLGRGLGVAASPALLAPFAAGDIASQIAAGDTPEDIATNPFNYLYPAFADQTPKLTRGLSPTLRKVARLGLSRAALTGLSRAGIGGLAASLAIQGAGLLDD